MSVLLEIENPLVSVNWLYQNIDATNLVVLNGTLPKVVLKKDELNTDEYQIPRARFFDIKREFSIQEAQFPNTVIEPKEFELKARELGINNDSCIVVYDEYGIYSSARVWWLFKSMGFENVAVLDGGFFNWKKEKYPTEKKQEKSFDKGSFTVDYQPDKIINSDRILSSLTKKSIQILDARSSGRYNSIDPEPRKGVRNGHIPNSKNLPYSSLLNEAKLKSKKELKEIFKAVNSDNKELIFSCGSGITACVLALGATIAGYDKLSVYDGSWTEWGSIEHLPIEK